MSVEDAIPDCCPHCRSSDWLVRAIDVRQDASEAGSGAADVALPGYESWSAQLVGAVGLLFVSAMATGGAAGEGRGFDSLAQGLMVAAFALGVAGIWQTRRIRARMRAIEPAVRYYHQQALYCENCAHVHFQTNLLPPGVEPFVAWSLRDYRRRLWYACGFASGSR